jgi:hypothetical protein
MTSAMDPCPYAAKRDKGRHNLCVLVPNKPRHPATLFCDRCGMTKQVRLTHYRPVEDIVAEAEALVRRA